MPFNPQPKGNKPKSKCSDAKLWKAFSEFIRLRDSDANGYCRCFTCGLVRFWKNIDCGHGVPRQHKSTKFHEQNNHAQCKRCNGFEGGMREQYERKVNEKYGPGTWDKLLIMSRTTCKRTQFEIDIMTSYYKKAAENLKKQKSLI